MVLSSVLRCPDPFSKTPGVVRGRRDGRVSFSTTTTPPQRQIYTVHGDIIIFVRLGNTTRTHAHARGLHSHGHHLTHTYTRTHTYARTRNTHTLNRFGTRTMKIRVSACVVCVCVTRWWFEEGTRREREMCGKKRGPNSTHNYTSARAISTTPGSLFHHAREIGGSPPCVRNTP